jgi:DNA-binding NtrC family response regulator
MSETRPVAPSTTNYKIAIVEDDRDLLEGLSKFLKSLGHRVRGFSSPVEFLGALEWTPNIDCVNGGVFSGQRGGVKVGH